MRNGTQLNGDDTGAQPGDVLRTQKEKAKTDVSASGPLANHDENGEASGQRNGLKTRPESLTNGIVQTRKRSRSGTRIVRPLDSAAAVKRRGFNDPDGTQIEKVRLHQYVERDLVHWSTTVQDGAEKRLLQEYKRDEKDYHMRLRGVDVVADYEDKSRYEEDEVNPRRRPPWLDPEAKPIMNNDTISKIYGPGYGQYGKFGNRVTAQGQAMVVYPRQRPPAGGRRARAIRMSRRELEKHAEQLDELVPIRLDIEWEKIRLRDTFTWNLNDRLTPPEIFAQQLVEDFGLPLEQCGPLIQHVSASLKEQIQDYYPHVFMDEGPVDPHLPYFAYKDDELRITIKLNITIGQHTLVDQFEWDINNSADSAELFARQMARDLSLSGEFTTAIAHSIREQSQLFTRSLYVLGHQFDGSIVTDEDLKSGFSPSPMPSAFRPYQAAKEFTPYLYELNEVELEKTELSLSREERRQKRSVHRRGGPALPDIKDRRRTIRTLIISSVIPGAAEKLEDSKIFKRTATAAAKGRRSGYGQKDGLDDSDESESDDSSPGSPTVPAHLLAGTARTRGMRGAANVAQAAMRGVHGRSATPEISILHHHETRTSGRRFGGKDYREESVDDSSPTFVVKLRISRDRFRRFLHELTKSKNKPAPLEPSHASRRSLSATPNQGPPLPGSMGPPTTPGPQHTQHLPHGSPGQLRDGQPINPLHPHAAQLGRVEADGPPTLDKPAVLLPNSARPIFPTNNILACSSKMA